MQGRRPYSGIKLKAIISRVQTLQWAQAHYSSQLQLSWETNHPEYDLMFQQGGWCEPDLYASSCFVIGNSWGTLCRARSLFSSKRNGGLCFVKQPNAWSGLWLWVSEHVKCECDGKWIMLDLMGHKRTEFVQSGANNPACLCCHSLSYAADAQPISSESLTEKWQN